MPPSLRSLATVFVSQSLLLQTGSRQLIAIVHYLGPLRGYFQQRKGLLGCIQPAGEIMRLLAWLSSTGQRERQRQRDRDVCRCLCTSLQLARDIQLPLASTKRLRGPLQHREARALWCERHTRGIRLPLTQHAHGCSQMPAEIRCHHCGAQPGTVSVEGPSGCQSRRTGIVHGRCGVS